MIPLPGECEVVEDVVTDIEEINSRIKIDTRGDRINNPRAIISSPAAAFNERISIDAGINSLETRSALKNFAKKLAFLYWDPDSFSYQIRQLVSAVEEI